jgi:hypothetical protein
MNQKTVCAFALVALFLTSAGAAPLMGEIEQADVSGMKLNHFFGPDRRARVGELTWTFAKDTFAIRKGTAAIPADLVSALLPHDAAAPAPDEITGRWELKDGKLRLSGIKAGGRAGRESVTLEPYKTAGTVIRIGHLPQYVFETTR